MSAAAGGRFAAERARLGLGVKELADKCGVTRQQVARIEKGDNAPGGDVLAGFARLGADVHFVLTGEHRVGLIDGTTYGMCEVAIVSAFAAARPGTAVPSAVRSGPVVQVYNRVILSPRAHVDLAATVREMAELMVASLNDPLDPVHLERNLFRQPTDHAVGGVTTTAQSGGVNIAGNVSGARIAGRDFIRDGRKD